MTRAGAIVVVVVAVALGGVMVGPSHVAGQADEQAITVDLGTVEGATVCVQQLSSDTNRIVVRGDDGNVTIHFDETRRVELEETRSAEGEIVLRTGRQNEALNDLAAGEECFTAQQTDVVVDARSVELRNRSVTGYTVEVGPERDVPAPAPFDPPHDIGGQNDGGDREDETESRNNETDRSANESVGGNESVGEGNESVGGVTENDGGNESDSRDNENDGHDDGEIRDNETETRGNETDGLDNESDGLTNESDGTTSDSAGDLPSNESGSESPNGDEQTATPTAPEADENDTETPARTGNRSTDDGVSDERESEP
ncbi:hypothetical protein C488_03891 [Natrinema pellirubrum DSM 15624]|uniref:Uncharacterized protein n=1 Tax=Natrinema pellirubrum (strain DSM 15624 / CIP 106293 / JCM 10476 / NCIMB 786 / 157) TaxID=797303 RepID=L0JK36_NATP1|nr:hypothetical protein [Natrinema pellirubrum]AGB30716.1 hypothetical protein Natpe_0797 [Natrinema pellirubrum DSM 15624]ELY80414.1 hypothetical protein C488_03891 [Natrinema pellirubrum DSM 15624]